MVACASLPVGSNALLSAGSVVGGLPAGCVGLVLALASVLAAWLRLVSVRRRNLCIAVWPTFVVVWCPLESVHADVS